MATRGLHTVQRRSGPTVSETDIRTIISVLAGQNWLAASALQSITGFDDRRVRAIAEASKGQVISSRYGYRLTREADQGEVLRCQRTLRSQARRMNRRAREIAAAAA